MDAGMRPADAGSRLPAADARRQTAEGRDAVELRGRRLQLGRKHRLLAARAVFSRGAWCCWGDRRRSSDRWWTSWFSLCTKYLEIDSSALSGHRSKGHHCRHKAKGQCPRATARGLAGSLASDSCAGEGCQTPETRRKRPGSARRGHPFAFTESWEIKALNAHVARAAGGRGRNELRNPLIRGWVPGDRHSCGS